jgi:NDP-sugar pyrophosphorylase family protein
VDGLDDSFIVSNGDVLTTLDLKTLVHAHRTSGAAATIATHCREVKVDLGVIHFNGSSEIIGYTEKPTYEFQVSMGIYVFEPCVLDYIEPNQYLDFPDLVLRLIDNGEKVCGFPFDGYWQDLGRPDDYEQAVAEFETLRDQILGPPSTAG